MKFQERISLAFRLENERRMSAGERRLTKTDLWKAAKVSSGAATQWFTGPGGMALETSMKVAPILRVNPFWLFDGSMPMQDVEQIPPPKGFESNVSAGPSTKGYIPLISSVQAGVWTEIADVMRPEEAEDWLPCPVKHGKNAFCLRVDGESMKNTGGKPSYDPGDIIFVDPDRCAQPGDRVIVKLDDQKQATFKQYVEEDGRKLLKALNPDWTPRYIEINGNATICGVIIGKWVPE